MKTRQPPRAGILNKQEATLLFEYYLQATMRHFFFFFFFFTDGIISYANIMFMTDHNLTKTCVVCLDNKNSFSAVTIMHTDWCTSVQDLLNEEDLMPVTDYLHVALRTTVHLAQRDFKGVTVPRCRDDLMSLTLGKRNPVVQWGQCCSNIIICTGMWNIIRGPSLAWWLQGWFPLKNIQLSN